MDQPTGAGAAPLPDMATVLSMSGLEYLEAILSGERPAPPICRPMSYALDSVEDGRVVFRGAPGPEALNPTGAVHGGWYGTLLDSAMSCAVWTKVPRGSVYTTLEYKVNLIRALPAGTEILCVGVLSHAGRTTGVATGEIRGAEDGRLYANGTATCLIMAVE